MLGDSVGHHHLVPSMKKIQHPIVLEAKLHPEFVDAVSEVIRFRSSQVATLISEQGKPPDTLSLVLLWKSVQPSLQRCRLIIPFLVEYDLNFRHPFTPHLFYQ